MRYTDLFEAPDDYDLQARYDHFNQLLFGGKLPKIPMRFGKMKNAGGVCKYSTHTPREYAAYPKHIRQQHAMLVHSSVNIVISDLYKRSSEALDGILVHEMIHAYLVFIENDLFDQHGAPFHKWVKKCSDILGWQVPLTDKTVGLELSDGVKDKTYIVLIRQDSRQLVYAILSPTAMTPELRADLIKRTERYADERLTAYEIKSPVWTKKALRNRVQRPKSGYKIGYFHLTDASLLDDLTHNGKVLFRAQQGAH